MDTSPDPRLERLEECLDHLGIIDPVIQELARMFFGQLLAAEADGESPCDSHGGERRSQGR